MEPTLEPMRPEHLRAVAGVHQAAFPDTTLTRLGDAFLRLYYGSLLADARGLALVALGGGGVCGFAAGMLGPRSFYRELWRQHALAFLWAAVPGLLRHPGLASRLVAAPRFAGLHPVGARDATLASIAVTPAVAGRGVGRGLFEAFRRLATERGGEALHWGAKASEAVAVAFYEHVPGAERRAVHGLGNELVYEYRLALVTAKP